MRSFQFDRTSLLGLALLTLSLTYAHAQITEVKPTPAVVSITVHSDQTAGKVPDGIFGSFIEPIDNSINNGIIAEILVNPSLEGGLWNHASLEAMFREQPELVGSMNSTGGIPIPWQSLNPTAGNRFERHYGDAANSWQSLEIMGVPNELTGIMQKVYLPVHRTLDYNVSFYAKHISGPSRVMVSLRDRDTGKVLASSEVDAPASGWTKYTSTLKLTRGQLRRLEAVNFAVSVQGDERIDLDQVSLMPSDAVATFDPDVIKMTKEMNLTELRLGGNFSSYYHWRDGIGPLDKRVTMENIAWGIPEYNNFGTDEFLKFCEMVKAVPQFNINMGSGTPQEGADWAHYIRDRYKGPLLLEMGNELYGKWQVGYPTLEEVPGRTLAFSKALRAAAPDATLFATGATPSNFHKWNAAQLTNPPGTYDLLSTHFIVGTNHVQLPSATPDFIAAAAYAVPFAVGGQLERMQAQVDATPGYKGKVHLAITEWLFNSKGDGERNFTNESPSSRNEGGAVMIASAFNTFMRHNAEVKLVNMTGMMEFAGIWKRREQVFATPAYYAFRLYTAAKGQDVLSVGTDSGTYSVQNGTSGYSNVADVPYLDTVATRTEDGKTLTLFCVNRSLGKTIDTKIDLGGFAASGVAEVEQIAAVSRYEMNDEVEPQHVIPKPSSVTVVDPHAVSFTFPAESVTVVRFHAR